MSKTLDAVREKYPEYKDVPDEKLATAIGSKYPQYLESDPGFKTEFDTFSSAKINADTARTQSEIVAGQRMAQNTGLTTALASDTASGKLPRAIIDKTAEVAGKAGELATKAILEIPKDVYNTAARITGKFGPLDEDASLLPKPFVETVKKDLEFGLRGTGMAGLPNPSSSFSRGVSESAGNTLESFTTPKGFAQLPILAIPGGAEAMAITMGASTPKQIETIYDTFRNPNSTAQDKWKVMADGGTHLAMTAGLAMHMTPEQIKAKYSPEEAAQKSSSITPLSDAVVEEVVKPQEQPQLKPVQATPEALPKPDLTVTPNEPVQTDIGQTTQSGEVQPTAVTLPLAPATGTALSEVLTTKPPEGGELQNEIVKNETSGELQGNGSDVNQTEQQGGEAHGDNEQRQGIQNPDELLQVTQPEAGAKPASEGFTEPSNMSRDQIKDAMDLISDSIETKKANKQPIPQAYIDRLGKLKEAYLENEPAAKGDDFVYTRSDVYGHPENSIDTEPLLPLKLRVSESSFQSIDSASQRVQQIRDKVAKLFNTKEGINKIEARSKLDLLMESAKELGRLKKEIAKRLLDQGKPVPPEVLADYPDLQAKAKPASEVTPAIKTPSGEVVTGEDHIDAYTKAKETIPDTSGSQEGFVNAEGKFLNREQAAKETGIPTKTEEGKLHSSDLPMEVPVEKPKAQAPKKFKPAKMDRPHDIIDEILNEHGKIKGKAASREGSEGYYTDEYKTAQKQRPELFSPTGSPPDVIAEDLRRSGMVGRDFTVDDLWDAINDAHKQRRAFNRGELPEQKADAFYKAISDNLAKKGTHKFNVGELEVGESFSLKGEKFTVTKIDPDTGTVIVEDGKKFGRQEIPDSAEIAVDQGSLEANPNKGDVEFLPEEDKPKAEEKITAKEIPPETLARIEKAEGKTYAKKYVKFANQFFGDKDVVEYRKNGVVVKEGDKSVLYPWAGTDDSTWRLGSPIDVTDQFKAPVEEMALGDATKSQKQLEQEKLAKARKDEIDRRRTKRLVGSDVDTTQDMLDPTKADNPLLSYKQEPPKPSESGPEIIGMGGAIPSEFEPSGGTPTGIKNATVDAERAKRGLPPAIQPLKRSFGEVWDRAMAKLDREPWLLDGQGNKPGLIEELKNKPRALTDEEDALLLHRQVDLQNEYGKATRDLKLAYDDGRMDDAERESDRLNAISDKLQELYDITKSSGTETARGLNARKMMADEHFTLAEMETGLRAAREGRPITDEERAKLAELEAQHKELSSQLEAERVRAQEAEAQAAIEKLRADEASKPKPLDPAIKRIFDKLKSGAQKAGDAAEARIMARRKEGKVFSGLDPAEQLDYALWGLARITEGVIDKGTWAAQMVAKWGDQLKPHIDDIWNQSTKLLEDAVEPVDAKKKQGVRKAMKDMDTSEVTADLKGKIEDKLKKGKNDEITNLVQRLARNFVKGGITDREALVDAVHQVVKDVAPSIDRRKTMDMISGYGDFKPLSKEAVAVKLRDLKGQMQQVAKLEDMQAGKPPLKTGVPRREVSKAESELVRKVNDAKREFQVPITDPESQLQSSLDTLKKRMQSRIDELETKMKNNDFAKVEKKPIRLDTKATDLRLKLNKVQQKYRDMVEAERLKNRDKYEKFFDKGVQLRRGYLLSSPPTIGKLFTAALWRIASQTTEQGVISGLRQIPLVKQVAEKAPRYGSGFSAKAEYKAYASALTNFMKDTRDIWGKGRSDLDVLFGDRSDLGSGDAKALDSSWVDYFGKLHAALKNPAKRAEFERAVAARAEFYGKQGIDIRDPMVQLRITSEAYQDAKRAIFMGNNILVNAYKAALRVFDTKNPETGKPYKLGRTVGLGARTIFPIVKVPTNIAMEVAEYAVGSATGITRLGVAFAKGIENLKPNEADAIMRNLAKGSLGAAAFAMGYYNPQSIGGYYQQGQKRKPGDVKYGSIKVNGVNVPSILIHNPLLEVMQLGATVRRVADSKLRKKDTETQGNLEGIKAGAVGVIEDIPFVRETFDWSKLQNPYERNQFLNEYAKSLLEPGALQWVAQQTDRAGGMLSGDTIDRKGRNLKEVMESGIPGLRKNVPVKKK